MHEPVIDLHTHTVFSDGTTTPEENARLAAAAGLAGIALTDHDTLDGWERMAAACAKARIGFVPGLEFSTELEPGGRSVHILGYWPDPDDRPLREECDRLRTERERRARAMVDRLAALGVAVAWARVAEIAGGAPVGRPHIAAAMVEAGAVPDLEAAFDEFLADGGPAWVPKHALAPEAGVALIRQAGGVAVLAHPGSTFPLETHRREVDAVLDLLQEAGLAGLEIDHPGHDEGVVAAWREIALERELLSTGSSDFHGDRKAARIGECTTPSGVVRRLYERAAHAREEDLAWLARQSD